MTVGGRILALTFAGFVLFVGMIGLMFLALQGTGHSAQRLDGGQRRLEVIADLKGNVHTYAERVAEVLLLGRSQIGDLQAARIDMERALALLTQVTREEIATLSGTDEIHGELPELDSARRMIELFHAIDLSATRVQTLQRDGEQAQATALFQREVEFRLSNELAPLLDNSLQNERKQTARLVAGMQATQRNALIGGAALALVALASMAGFGLVLRRSIVSPLRALTSAAGAMEAGKLEQRVDIAGHDEFARLSQAFNRMAAGLEGQRTRRLETVDRLSAELEGRAKQWREASERLRMIDSRHAQFLADVSHELRTPLTILRGEADVALRGQDNAAEHRRALERIQGQAIELGRVLEDLIAFARADAENQGHIAAETRLDEVVGAAIQEGRILAEPREVSIAAAFGDDGCRINADFRRLKQALVIGIDNAVKHSPPGGQIRVETALAPGQAKIRILDNGPGIAAEDQPRVFERFYRGRAESELLNDGLGIGLAIAREIVERHDGRILLENRTAGGAMLEMTLPLAGGAPS